MKIKIGTRKSKLALIQTQMVINALKNAFPDIETELVHILTYGDKILDKPLASIGGKGVFVTEIERAMQCGEIDIAVHSAKDLPIELAENLEIGAVLKRGDYRDVLITAKRKPFENHKGFLVGTGSIRRRKNMKNIYPDVSFKDIRGNVDTRLNKLLSGDYDGIILAAAGIKRMGIEEGEQFKFRYFDYKEFLPSPCQGIIAVECRKNTSVSAALGKISDMETFISFETERRVAELLGGDCSVPLGAYSYISDGKIFLTVSKSSDKVIEGNADILDRTELAEELVSKL